MIAHPLISNKLRFEFAKPALYSNRCLLRLKIFEKLPLAGFIEMDDNSISSAGRDFFAHNGADIVPILMENRFAYGENEAWGVSCAFGCREHRVRFRLFAHKRRQIDEHGVVALRAANPEILILRFAFDHGLRSFACLPRARLAYDLLTRRAGAVGA
jgi:hypothetical protein